MKRPWKAGGAYTHRTVKTVRTGKKEIQRRGSKLYLEGKPNSQQNIKFLHRTSRNNEKYTVNRVFQKFEISWIQFVSVCPPPKCSSFTGFTL
jgi:hypothetical protein